MDNQKYKFMILSFWKNMEVPPASVANNVGKRWTMDEENQVLGMLSSGKSFKEIGKHLGRTPTAIESRALMKVAKMVTPQMTIDCLAEIYGLSKKSIQERMDKEKEVLPTENKYKKWTDEEKDTLLEMRLNRKPYSDIAQVLKRTESAVKAKALGIAIQLIDERVSVEEVAQLYGSTPDELKELIQSTRTKKYQSTRLYQSRTIVKKNESKEVTNVELKEILMEIRDLLRVMVTPK